MAQKNVVKLFEDKKVRAKWDEDEEEYYFSIIDVIAILTDSKNPNRYWSDLKKKLREEQFEPYENIVRLKLKSSDGKMRLTDVADTKQLLRIIQSVPSPNAEPFKMWLAEVGKERLDEIADPQIAIERAISTYRKKGYSEEWITERLKTIDFRKELTAEWNRAGIREGYEYGILTNEVTNAWSGMTTKEYKSYKGLKKENLRDNMSNVELVLDMLAEVSTTEISKSENPEGLEESKEIAKRGGGIAGDARKNLEKESGKKVITRDNAKNPKKLDK
ncbi:Bro-N domain-containing protein [Methanobrevibacter sp. OttesenSCG-928-K11]|nr:Bro-N domain-containing protein [Methanobrevibacter sp. OttesenSCG-928-K11]MDL2270524.1 Bro-N domain-containing protein [Methanobrevibacter sp. OttesenSCG-928-I08]